MKINFKLWWSTIPLISTKRTTTFHLNSLNTKNNGTPDSGFGQVQKSGCVKLIKILIKRLHTWINDCFYIRSIVISTVDNFKTSVCPIQLLLRGIKIHGSRSIHMWYSDGRNNTEVSIQQIHSTNYMISYKQ